MKDLIRKILKEVSVDKKERIGSGSFHDVYPLKYVLKGFVEMKMAHHLHLK